MSLTRGSLYRFNYLWSREHEKSEVSGRKARPVCLVVRSSASPAALFLFPITTQAPSTDTIALEVPIAELRRGGLATPCWIVVDEYNRVDEDELYDFESLTPLGTFSLAFLKQVAEEIAEAAKRRRLKAVPRS